MYAFEPTRHNRWELPKWQQSFALAVLAAAAGWLLGSEGTFGQGQPKEPGARRAMLIGVENYRKAPPLPGVANDVKELGMTLRERGGYEVTEIVDAAGAAPAPPSDAATSPSKSLQTAMEAWLAQVQPEDVALIYFSGHGFRAKDGKLYLAAIDCDPADPVPGGVPVTWLRQQLAARKARFRLLVIDACHAGCDKGEKPAPGITAKELADPFEGLAAVVTLASSLSDEKSLFWDEKRQSLFS